MNEKQLAERIFYPKKISDARGELVVKSNRPKGKKYNRRQGVTDGD